GDDPRAGGRKEGPLVCGSVLGHHLSAGVCVGARLHAARAAGGDLRSTGDPHRVAHLVLGTPRAGIEGQSAAARGRIVPRVRPDPVGVVDGVQPTGGSNRVIPHGGRRVDVPGFFAPASASPLDRADAARIGGRLGGPAGSISGTMAAFARSFAGGGFWPRRLV